MQPIMQIIPKDSVVVNHDELRKSIKLENLPIISIEVPQGELLTDFALCHAIQKEELGLPNSSRHPLTLWRPQHKSKQPLAQLGQSPVVIPRDEEIFIGRNLHDGGVLWYRVCIRVATNEGTTGVSDASAAETKKQKIDRLLSQLATLHSELRSVLQE